ncbi:GNAT family N-acetyltransferase [Cohnella sp. JJ-181]|uniref:GNAT family N-acetyltransferase n=1 Tax=Cohnella rhizoplanae TaxID=2974897 RepID=UPI0022FF7F7A|nr:GNAT family N-acetyltransferase [Cohnella sp. JJ-181]CAI6082268.1 Acetyltransferase YpeA [Cohnella sp. JJ-181]
MPIRPAGRADALAVSRLVLLAIGDIACKLTGQRGEAAVVAKLIEYYLKPGNRFSAERHALLTAENGEIAGTILCYGGAEAPALYAPIADQLRSDGCGDVVQDREADADEYYIDAVAVFPAYRGRGYAKALIGRAETDAALGGYAGIALNVDVDNRDAHALYSRLGFEEDKRISINGHPFRHMRKLLPGPGGQADDF